MIIKEITIENFLCYHGSKRIAVEPGLNVLLGENGEGKTKLFEALEWLFSDQGNRSEIYVSAKKIAKTPIGESFKVGVLIKVEQFGEIKTLKRSFTVTKRDEQTFDAGRPNLEGITETRSGERTPFDGKTLLDQIFPAEFRKYSMFKGEEEVNIFKNEDALSNLINLFSEGRYFKKYVDRSRGVKKLMELAVEANSRNNQKNQREYNSLTTEIESYKHRKHDAQIELRDERKNLTDTEKLIEEASRYVHHADELELINNTIKALENKIEAQESSLKEDYTTYLFDEGWMLNKFEETYQKFSKKVTEYSHDRRALQKQFDREEGVREGERKLRLELINNVVPLPADTPSKAIMEEMIKDQICKVCNREAPEGSEAHNFMRSRLESFIESQKAKLVEEEEPEVLFLKNYASHLDVLRNVNENQLLKLRTVESDIKECMDFNQSRKAEINRLNEQLEQQENKRSQIIGEADLGAEKLSVVLKDYNNWQRDLKSYNKNINLLEIRIAGYDRQLEQLIAKKEGIDLTSVNAQYINSRDIIRDIHTIFSDTKDRKFREFIRLLERKSNDVFAEINVDAFTGTIIFSETKNGDDFDVNIGLEEEDGKVYHMPNRSLETSMYISILMAISEITHEIREESYPLIFDAPTSSFGESKTSAFLNTIYEQSNQVIILTKDFLAKDRNGELYVKDEFREVKRHKALWLKLKRPFNKLELKTIETEVLDI